MKNFSLSLSLLTLFASNIQAQSPTGYLQPANISVCANNGPFTVQNISPPVGGWPNQFVLSVEIFVVPSNGIPLPSNIYTVANPWSAFPDCFGGVPGNNPLRFASPAIGDPNYFAINPTSQYNVSTRCYDFVIDLLNASHSYDDIEVLSFNFVLDCSAMNGISSSAMLIQRWFFNGNPGSGIPIPTFLNIQPPIPIPVSQPNLVQVPIGQQLITIDAPYSDDIQYWYFSYLNNGSSPVDINIADFETTPCSSYVLDGSHPILWEQTNSPNPPLTFNAANTFPGTSTISIPINEYLHIRQQVKIIDCIKDCNGTGPANTPSVDFKWKCANISSPPGCSGCQDDYNRQINYTEGVSSYKITRTLPNDQTALHNVNCQGNSTSWSFDIENTGNTILPEVNIDLENLFPGTFSLIDYTTFHITDYFGCSGVCNTVQPPVFVTPPTFGTCSMPVSGSLTNELHFAILNLPPGGKSSVQLDIVHLVSDDPLFFNTAKYYNQWQIQSVCTTKCNDIINPDYDNSVIGLGNGISGHSTSNNPLNDDVNLLTAFSGNPMHTTIFPPFLPPPANYFPNSPEYYLVDFNNLFGNIDDQQALGYSLSTSSEISGYLKVEINLKQGLTIANPNDISIAFSGGTVPVQIFPVFFKDLLLPNSSYNLVSNGTATTNAGGIMVNTFPAGNSTCTPAVSTLYFRLSDIDAILPAGMSRSDIFKQGFLVLGITPCCNSGASPSVYTIKLSLLPNESCFAFDLTTGTVTPNGTAVECWIPLQEINGDIFVHCPGCLAPGIIIDDYTISRTSLGFPDADDNGIADNTTSAIPYYSGLNAIDPLINLYLPEYNNLKLEYSTFGDEIEDYLIAHFQDGDNTIGGYEYSDMKNDGATLDVIQLYRTFQNSGSSQYDIQVTGFDFYLDDGSWTGGLITADKSDFNANVKNYPTLLKLSVTGNDVMQYFTRGSIPDDDKMLFTFSESMLNSPPAGTLSYYNGFGSTNLVDFDVSQQYRLKVRYKVCGNPAPVSIGQADDGAISDVMYLTGLAKSIIPLTITAMLPSATEVCSVLGGCFSSLSSCTPCVPVTKQQLADPYLYYCEGNGAMHHFVSTLFKNTADYYLKNDNTDSECTAAIDIKTASHYSVNTGNSPNNFFINEFKIPKLFQTTFTVNEPPDWDWKKNAINDVDAMIKSYNCENVYNCGVSSPSVPILGISSAPQLNFNLSSPLTFSCLSSNIPSGPFIADEVSAQRVQLFLEPEDCNFTNPPAAALVSDCIIKFENNLQACSEPTNGCAFEIDQQENSGANDKYRTILAPNPNIVATFLPPTFNSSSGTVIWDFEVTNYSSLSNPFITPAKNVYIALDPLPSFIDVSSMQVNYSLYKQGSIVATSGPYTSNGLVNGHYIWLTPTGTLNQLESGYKLKGTITTTITNCTGFPRNFDFLWGWTCEQPAGPIAPSPSVLCDFNQSNVEVNFTPGVLSAKNYSFSASGYTACDEDPLTAIATFQNNSSSDLTLSNLTINIPSGSFVQAVLTGYDYKCTGTITPITTFPLTVLHPGECLGIELEVVTNGCHFGLLEMPKVEITGTDFCSNNFSCINDLGFLSGSGTSECTDCYRITKTVSPSTAFVGDPVTFTIVVEGNNSTATTNLQVQDNYPPDFIEAPNTTTWPVYINVPAIGAAPPIIVSGAYNDIVSCVDVPGSTNTATISSTNQSASACVEVVCPDISSCDYFIWQDDITSGVFGNSNNYKTCAYIDENVTLTVDNQLALNYLILYLGPGAQIVVSQSNKLTLNTCTLSSCPYMWRGIQLDPAAGISIIKSTIKDAERAIYATSDAHIEVSDSYIYDCVTGISNATTGNGSTWNLKGFIYGSEIGKDGLILKKEYPGNSSSIPPQPPHGKIGRAGISLTDIFKFNDFKIGDNLKNQNKFFNINFGVDIKNAEIEITNSYFTEIRADQAYRTNLIQNLGAAVYADNKDYMSGIGSHLRFRPLPSGLNTIENCDIGLFNRVYNVDLDRIKMDAVETGIRATENAHCVNIVSNCEIHSNRTGVHWFNNFDSDRMLLTESNVVNERAFGTAINITEFLDNNFANYQIVNNPMLRANNGGFVIQAWNVDDANIGYNNIFVENPHTGPTSLVGSTGISVGAGQSNNIYCNSTNTNVPHSDPNSFGLSISGSTANTISCNDIHNATNGVFFGGDCNSTRLRGNALVENSVGLRLNGQAIIGPQLHHGNRWFNTNSISSAFKAPGQAGPQLSLFRIHTQSLPFWPQSIFPPSNWFIPQSSSNFFDCVSTNSCIAFINDPDPDDQARIATDRLIALDSIQFMEYNDEMQTILRSRLFEAIQRDSGLYLNDPVFVDFYSDILGSPSGEISNVGLQLAEAMTIDSISYATLVATNSLINLLLDSVGNLDSVNRINPDPANDILREQYSIQITNLRNVATSILASHALSAGLIRDSLVLINSAIQPSELPDVNRHSLFEILGEYYERGDSAIYSHYNTLYSIAQQCPYAGGPAVFIARGLLRIVNDSIDYFDDVVCLQAGYYRSLNPNSDKEQRIKLLPNPAKNTVEVYSVQPSDQSSSIKIYSNVGELIYSSLSETGVLLKTIDVSSFSPGVYAVSVGENRINYSVKLVIIK